MPIVKFVGGPMQGHHPVDCPSGQLPPNMAIPVHKTNAEVEHSHFPDGLAIYVLAGDHYGFAGVDESEQTREILKNQREEEIARDAAKHLYDRPDNSIYSVPPTDAHKQVFIQAGHRKGEVDELIAPVIWQVWRLGLDTYGSCQNRPSKMTDAGKAYIAFLLYKDGERFHTLLSDAAISSEIRKASIKTQNARTGGVTELRGAIITFPPSDMEKIEKALQGVK